MWNTGLDEAQAGIKISGRNINNLSYTDDTTLMAENEEELRASWWRWKRVKNLKLNIKNIITSWQIEGENLEAVADFLSLGSKITVDSDAAMKLEDAYSSEGKL